MRKRMSYRKIRWEIIAILSTDDRRGRPVILSSQVANMEEAVLNVVASVYGISESKEEIAAEVHALLDSTSERQTAAKITCKSKEKI